MDDDAGEVVEPERVVDKVAVRIALQEQHLAVEGGGPLGDAVDHRDLGARRCRLEGVGLHGQHYPVEISGFGGVEGFVHPLDCCGDAGLHLGGLVVGRHGLADASPGGEAVVAADDMQRRERDP